jgi:beta-barrel assembly-enhancing protease
VNGSIQATLFGPGLPGTGRVVQVRVRAGQIHIAHASHTDVVACTACTAGVGGFNHDQLQLLWTDPLTRGEHALIALTPEDQAALLHQLSALPEGTLPTLAQWRRGTGRQRWVWRTLLGSLATLALATVLLVWNHDRVVQWIAWQIPQHVETRLGEGILAQLERDKALLAPGAATALLQQMGDRLTAGSAYHYQWHVIDDKDVNAFALPGGIIVVHSALLQAAQSADEVAGVLAHEIQHVEQRHALRNMVNQAGLAAAMLVVLGDLNSVVLLIAHQASAQYFSRSMETEADLRGARLLRERKFLVEPMVTMFERLGEAQAGHSNQKPRANRDEEGSFTAWLSSHPRVEERIRALKAVIAAEPCTDCRAAVADWPAVLADLKTQLAAPRKP